MTWDWRGPVATDTLSGMSGQASGVSNARVHVGTQGWNYDFWAGMLYPRGTKPADRLELYSRLFDSVEIDSTFYGMPPEGRFRTWYERTPAHFLFTAKLPREITHDARLVGVEHLLHEFCDRAAELEEKLGPLLIQLPPGMAVDERPAVEAFVRSLPRELEFAIEFRDATWFDDRTMDLLREFDVTLAASIGPWMTSRDALAVAASAPGRFQYLRWMASPRHQELNSEIVAERDEDLSDWAQRILESLPDKPTVYAYFNNDYQGHSPESARRLQALLGLAPIDPEALLEQKELF